MAGRPDRTTTPAAIERSKRDAEIVRRKVNGETLAEIGAAVGLHKSSVWQIIRDAMVAEMTPHVQSLRDKELARFEYLRAEVQGVIDRRHAVLHQGVDTGFDDDGPLLAAVRLDKELSESMRRMMGVDMPVRVDATSSVRFELVGVDMDALR
jgi:hypothetical protein